MTPTYEEQLAKALWGARTLDDVKTVRTLASRVFGEVAYRPVGDRPNNIGTIRLASDPTLAIVERITNGMDAILDLGHLDHPEDHPGTPREAAQMWFGVPKPGLAEMPEISRRKLGSKLQFTLHDSGDQKRPTVTIDDVGTGQLPRAFPRTLLSLNESNKVAQPWTMGTYGQGGASTFGFSQATIVISRRHPSHAEGAPDEIGWTIVDEEFDPTTQALPSYRYLVMPNRDVPSLRPDLFSDLAYGTRIIHVGYDLQGLAGPFTTNVWQFLNAALFDPVLPFLLAGTRGKEPTYGTRVITGNAARLARPDRAQGDVAVVHADAVKHDLGADRGQVTYRYWVLQRPEDSKTGNDPTAAYIRADSAVSMTLFGQRQDAESRQWVKDNAKLPFLYRSVVIQIDADALTALGKREVFAATRERATRSDLKTMIYEHLAKVLEDDEQLSRLDHLEKERLLRRSTSVANEKIRERLARFIQTRLRNERTAGSSRDGGTGGTKRKPAGGPRGERDTDDSALHNVPTRMRFTRDRIPIHQDAAAYVWVEIDAKNGYLPEHADDLSLTLAGPGSSHVRDTMKSDLLGGRTRWYFEAQPTAPQGEIRVEAELMTPNGILQARTTLVVQPRIESSSKNGRGTIPASGPEVKWVTKEELLEHRLLIGDVGYVTVDTDETIIFVNRAYPTLESALTGRRLTAEQIQLRADRYLYPVACALWLQDHALKRTVVRPGEDYIRAELGRVADAVLAAIDPDVEVEPASD